MDSRQALIKLRDILAELYETKELARIVVYGAGLKESDIDIDGSAKEIWHNILRLAEKQGKLRDVLMIAFDDYSNHKKLREAWNAYQLSEFHEPLPPLDNPTENERPQKTGCVVLLPWALIVIFVIFLFAITSIYFPGLLPFSARPKATPTFTRTPMDTPTLEAMLTLEPPTTPTLTSAPTATPTLIPEPATTTPTLMPEPTTPEPAVLPTLVSEPAEPSFAGSWAGTTDQGEPISFQVASDNGGGEAFNLLVTFVFDSPCPIGRVVFKSIDSGHINGGPAYSFEFFNIKSSEAIANIQGSFSSSVEASGILTVNDTRDPSARQAQKCPFMTTINWTATR